MFELAILVISQAVGGGEAPMRDQCAARASASANSWERVKEPALGPYCELLASATSKLSSKPPAPLAALKSLEAAEKILPERLSTLVLRAQALAMAGDLASAYDAFRDAKKRSPNLLDDPRALLSFARVAASVGQLGESLGVYRVLLMRTSTLPSADRAEVPLEAGIVAMGEGDLAEAVRCLRIAEKESNDFERVLAGLGAALAADRVKGGASAAKTNLPEETARRFLAATESQIAQIPPADRDAWRAFALDALRSPEAKEAWKRAANAGGHYAAYAAAKVRPR